MGGRGASSGGIAGGVGGGSGRRLNAETTSLVSAREDKQNEVDQTLGVLRAVERSYGINADLNDVQLATIKGDTGVMAYYDAGGNLAINQAYFDSAKMSRAYDECVQAGYHPPRGTKTGLEAVAAHEMGHRLTDIAGEKLGYGSWAIDKVASEVVNRAARKSGAESPSMFRSQISGYGASNNAEAIAEAFADVFCNGYRAKSASRAVVTELNAILK